jgi:hypothetical protein
MDESSFRWNKVPIMVLPWYVTFVSARGFTLYITIYLLFSGKEEVGSYVRHAHLANFPSHRLEHG